MDLTGQERIAAPREAVWNALNDIETLKACIPGCDNLERINEHQIRAGIKVSFGVMKVGFHGLLELSNMVPPHSYTISGKAKERLPVLPKGQPMCASRKMAMRQFYPMKFKEMPVAKLPRSAPGF